MVALVTGATGFLGKEIIRQHLCDEVITLARNNSSIICDLSREQPQLPKVDLVIHCAGKAHVIPKTKSEEENFFQVNVLGTVNLLTALTQTGDLPKAFVFISSVAVYGADFGSLLKEDAPLNAKDAYGQSKIQAEAIISEWCKSNSVKCSILRLPLLSGQVPPGNLNAMIKGIRKGYYFNVAGGCARKSMVRIEDVAGIILKAAVIGGVYNLTDGYHPSFHELSGKIALQVGKKQPFNIPLWLAGLMAKIGDLGGSKMPINSIKLKKIISSLTFDDEKAKEVLAWNPKSVLEHFKV